MCKIRVATLEDVNSLVEINIEIHKIHADKYPAIFKTNITKIDVVNDISAAIQEERNKIYVLEKDFNVIGYCWFRVMHTAETSLFHATNNLHIVHFGVLQEFKGLGFGKKLMSEILNISKTYKVNQIIVDAWAFNETAISFYKGCGFELRNEIMWFKGSIA